EKLIGLSACAALRAPSPSNAAAAERPATPRNVRRSMLMDSSSSCERGWRHERLELTLEQTREVKTREIAVLRSDDLNADRQPRRREPARRGRGRQERHARLA